MLPPPRRRRRRKGGTAGSGSKNVAWRSNSTRIFYLVEFFFRSGQRSSVWHADVASVAPSSRHYKWWRPGDSTPVTPAPVLPDCVTLQLKTIGLCSSMQSGVRRVIRDRLAIKFWTPRKRVQGHRPNRRTCRSRSHGSFKSRPLTQGKQSGPARVQSPSLNHFPTLAEQYSTHLYH